MSTNAHRRRARHPQNRPFGLFASQGVIKAIESQGDSVATHPSDLRRFAALLDVELPTDPTFFMLFQDEKPSPDDEGSILVYLDGEPITNEVVVRGLAWALLAYKHESTRGQRQTPGALLTGIGTIASIVGGIANNYQATYAGIVATLAGGLAFAHANRLPDPYPPLPDLAGFRSPIEVVGGANPRT